MAITGIGSTNTYIYNVKTGKLATKDGSADDFVDYFNGDRNAAQTDTLNGYDQRKKSGIENMLMLMQAGRLRVKGMDTAQNQDTYEITSEIEDVVTTNFSVNGEKILTSYDMCAFSFIDSPTADDLLYRTRDSRGYDASDNSIHIAAGDVFDLGNGYVLTVKDDHIQLDGTGRGQDMEDKKAKQLAYGLNALIRFADQQWMSEMIDRESTPMLLSLLHELGVDTEKEFQINGTKCEIRSGRIREAGNRFAVPGSVYRNALKQYEELLSMPVSEMAKA